MPWNGSGVFNRIYSWTADAAASIDILPDRMDTDTNDIAAGLEHCLTVNGETLPVANLNLNGYKIVNSGAGTNPGDYVTVAQVTGGGGAIPSGGYLPITGGTCTGPVTVQGGITSSGSNAALLFNARDGSANWLWYATGNVARLWTGGDKFTVDNAGGATVVGGLNVGTSLTVSGAATVNNGLVVYNALDVASGNFTVSAGNVNVTGNIGTGASNTIATGYVSANYNITAGGSVQGGYVVSTGDVHADANLTTSNGCYAGYFSSSGNANVAGSIAINGNTTTGSLNVSGNSSTANILMANNCFLNCQQTGGSYPIAIGMGSDNILHLGNAGNYLHVDAALAWFVCHAVPVSDAAYYCGLAATAWLGVESYAYYTASDGRKKTDLSTLPVDCLDLVRRIDPQQYRLTVGPAEERDKIHWGFVAQHVGEVFRAAGIEWGGHKIGDDEEQSESLSFNDMLACLWRAVQQLAESMDGTRPA